MFQTTNQFQWSSNGFSPIFPRELPKTTPGLGWADWGSWVNFKKEKAPIALIAPVEHNEDKKMSQVYSVQNFEK